MLRVQNHDCPARAVIRAANVYTKRVIENPFPGTQMFVQSWNNKCLQQGYISSRFVSSFDNLVCLEAYGTTLTKCFVVLLKNRGNGVQYKHCIRTIICTHIMVLNYNNVGTHKSNGIKFLLNSYHQWLVRHRPLCREIYRQQCP